MRAEWSRGSSETPTVPCRSRMRPSLRDRLGGEGGRAREETHRVEADAGVPPGAAPEEEVQTLRRAAGEDGIGERLLELGAQGRILLHHVARQLLQHVRLRVLLLLE